MGEFDNCKIDFLEFVALYRKYYPNGGSSLCDLSYKLKRYGLDYGCWECIAMSFKEGEKMNFREYQIKTRRTDVGTSAQDCIKPGWLYYVLGIAGESGEFAEKIKKLFRDKKGIIDAEFKEAVIKEIGDILWYQARFLDSLDINFNDVAATNITKLLDRMKRNKLHGEGDNR